MAADDLFELQEELLAAGVAVLDTIPVDHPALSGAPTRRFVAAPGSVAYDCEQLTVHTTGITTALAGPQNTPMTSGKRHVYGRITQPMLVLTLIRDCMPIARREGKTVRLPTAAEQEAASRQLNADGWALWNGIFTMLKEEQLLTRCTAVEWDNFTPYGPAGSFGGWVLTLRPHLPGYSVEVGS